VAYQPNKGKILFGDAKIKPEPIHKRAHPANPFGNERGAMNLSEIMTREMSVPHDMGDTARRSLAQTV
jgi:hypothetical protein